MPILSGSWNTHDFRACFFKSKWAAAPAPFPEFFPFPPPFQLLPAKNICFGSEYHVYRAEIMCFKPF